MLSKRNQLVSIRGVGNAFFILRCGPPAPAPPHAVPSGLLFPPAFPCTCLGSALPSARRPAGPYKRWDQQRLCGLREVGCIEGLILDSLEPPACKGCAHSCPLVPSTGHPFRPEWERRPAGGSAVSPRWMPGATALVCCTSAVTADSPAPPLPGLGPITQSPGPVRLRPGGAHEGRGVSIAAACNPRACFPGR